MHQAAINEFPFVEALPKREKSKLARVWEHFQDVRAAAAEHGTLLPQHYVADLLNLSKQRIHQLVNDGRLRSVDVGGLRYVTESSILAFAELERKTGRPPKLPGARAIFGKALESAREIATKNS